MIKSLSNIKLPKKINKKSGFSLIHHVLVKGIFKHYGYIEITKNEINIK